MSELLRITHSVSESHLNSIEQAIISLTTRNKGGQAVTEPGILTEDVEFHRKARPVK
jgi:hypothetical protein